MLADIYEFTWTLLLKEERLLELSEEERVIKMIDHKEIRTFCLNALMCMLCQGCFTVLLIYSDLKALNNWKAKSEVIVCRQLASVLFHFWFGAEIKSAINLVQYTVLNPD